MRAFIIICALVSVCIADELVADSESKKPISIKIKFWFVRFYY